ncbi:hypothetical protein ACWCQZ_46400 [Streptomyces sp. NPDC002285]
MKYQQRLQVAVRERLGKLMTTEKPQPTAIATEQKNRATTAASMDDEAVFGPVLYKLSLTGRRFGKDQFGPVLRRDLG